MYSIGEFSKITGLTVKTLRFYHEHGVLAPSHVDEQTGYRYYAANKIETARIIARLRELEVPLADIAEILRRCDDDANLIDFLEQHRRSVQDKLQQYRSIDAALDRILAHERKAQSIMNQTDFAVEEKTLDAMLIAGVRMRGAYRDCGPAFGRIGRSFGRHVCGKPLLLHYDQEFKEDDADFEACFPVRKGSDVDGIVVRKLPGGLCAALLHQGPYEELGRSYAKILAYVKQHGYTIAMPTREIYIKGPGMVFKGNPKKYLTEIQMLIGK